jgi:hypothetical protein
LLFVDALSLIKTTVMKSAISEDTRGGVDKALAPARLRDGKMAARYRKRITFHCSELNALQEPAYNLVVLSCNIACQTVASPWQDRSAAKSSARKFDDDGKPLIGDVLHPNYAAMALHRITRDCHA